MDRKLAIKGPAVGGPIAGRGFTKEYQKCLQNQDNPFGHPARYPQWQVPYHAVNFPENSGLITASQNFADKSLCGRQ